MMKPSKTNPSKYDILNWINNLLPKSIKKVNTIEQLGSGAAYLHLLQVLRPGVVRPERIINDPQNHYEATTNLKLLASAFERLNLQHCFEIEKVAQMKYQDNYHLACFFFRLYAAEQSEKQVVCQQTLLKTAQPAKKVRIVLPRNPISLPLKKTTTTPLNKTTPLELRPNSQAQLEPIDQQHQIDQAKSQKLAKIASILHLERKDQKVYSIHSQPIKCDTSERSQQPKTNSITASFKRFLRPSICERSKYLKEFVDENIPRHNYQVNMRWEAQVKPAEAVSMGKEGKVEQLLSQRKGEENQQMNRQDSVTEQNRQFAIQVEGEREKDESLMFGI